MPQPLLTAAASGQIMNVHTAQVSSVKGQGGADTSYWREKGLPGLPLKFLAERFQFP